MSYENVPKNILEKAVLTRQGAPDFTKLAADAFPTPSVDEGGAILEDTDTGDRYVWTSTQWLRVVTAGAPHTFPMDFFIEVSKGKIPGHSLVPVLGRIASTVGTNVFEDLWEPGGTMTEILAAESWDISSSDNVDDKAGGAGALTVLVPSLDADHNPQLTTVTLNGTTAVPLDNTHIEPGNGAIVLGVGANRKNTGLIEIRKAGSAIGADVRMTIPAGHSLSKDARYTVPAGKTAFLVQSTFFYPKNADGITRNLIRLPDAAILVGLDIPFYQTSFQFDVRGPFPLGEKTRVDFQVSTAASGIELQAIFDLLEIDNAYL